MHVDALPTIPFRFLGMGRLAVLHLCASQLIGYLKIWHEFCLISEGWDHLTGCWHQGQQPKGLAGELGIHFS